MNLEFDLLAAYSGSKTKTESIISVNDKNNNTLQLEALRMVNLNLEHELQLMSDNLDWNPLFNTPTLKTHASSIARAIVYFPCPG